VTSGAEVTAALNKARKQLQMMKESQQKTEAAAKRRVQIAQKVLKSNRQLVSENTMLKQRLQAGLAPAPQKGPKRLDEGRQKSRPVTTRATILENQDNRPAPQTRAQKPQGNGVFGVNEIASVMDDMVI
jgi:hypothetical protein